MSYELIITEKPSAAVKIAQALSDKSPKKLSSREKVPYFEITHNGKKIKIVSAVGHIYGLSQKEKSRKYPTFDISWVPSADVSKNSSFTRKYLNTIKRLAKEASEFTVATDYDVEGEVIGLNIVRYACKKEDANRMKFSTLTKSDLVKSYENKKPTLNWGQAKAGETRHKMDWYFGINLLRALSAAVKSVGKFQILSTGRVQGPALKLVVDKEKTISAFIPEPYFEIKFNGTIKSGEIEALHKAGKIFEKEVAQTIFEKVKNQKTAIAIKVTKKQFTTNPPTPFDLTSLQIEAHKCLKITPKNTLSTAQELYTKGYISYPRTSSQQLPKEIGYNKILSELLKQPAYYKLAEQVLKKGSLKPNNGKKTDPAHPAIYPTGVVPSFKNDYEKKLYDLIVKRFFAVFGEAATRETMTVEFDCNSEIFFTKGTTTVKKGWFTLYGNYVMLKEVELPLIEKGDICNIKKIEKLDKETTPPKRYTEASIIKQLEKENLGTKATRAQIIETLKDRGYIEGKALRATQLGIRTEETLEKYSPRIVDPELTRNFELEMKAIREKGKGQQKVLDDSIVAVTEIVDKFNKHLNEIGKELYSANRETQENLSRIGKCQKCEDGELHLRHGKFGPFVACNKYPECKTTYKVPKNALVKGNGEKCEKCDYPIVLVQKGKKAPQKYCINPDCETRSNGDSKNYPEENTICPKCGKGKMVLRKSFYGQFLGCSNYPECKTMMKIVNGKVDKENIISK